MHEQHGSNVVGELAGLPASALEDVFAAAAHVVHETIFQQAYAPVPMEGRGLVVDCARATGELTIYAATQSPHEVRLFCSRLLGVPEHRIRVIMRDTGGGFGQKVLVQRDEMCLMLAAPKVGAPLKWVEDRSENLLAAGKSRHEHGDRDDGVRRRRRDPAPRTSTSCPDCGAYPTPWPVGPGGRGRHALPRSVPRAARRLRDQVDLHEHRRAHRVPRAVAVRVARPRGAARHRGAPDGHRSRRSCGAATCCAHDELPYANPNGMTYDSISPLETFEQALAMLDYDAFRAEQAAARAARPLPRRRHLELRRAVDARLRRRTRTEAATIRIEPSGAVNVYIAGGSTGNSLETTVVQLAADALGVDIDDVHTIQGDTAVTGFGAGTAGSRSASMTAGAVARDRERSCASASPRSPRTGSKRPSTTSSSPRAARSCGARPSIGIVARASSPRSRTSSPPRCRRACRPGSKRARATPRATPSIWVNATHVCTCEVDVDDRPGRRCCATS